MGNSPRLKHGDITSKILHVFFKKVYHQLGYGFLEKVYENAIVIELRRMGLKVTPQAKIDVHYGSEIVGEYYADLLVEDAVIVVNINGQSAAELDGTSGDYGGNIANVDAVGTPDAVALNIVI